MRVDQTFSARRTRTHSETPVGKGSTSVAFNYRAACRGRSHTEYTAKIGVLSEEADESLGWLEFAEAAALMKSDDLTRLIREADELAAIMSASYGTAREKERLRRVPNHPISTPRDGSADHSDHDPTYSFAPRMPACSIASRLWHAVTPEPQ